MESLITYFRKQFQRRTHKVHAIKIATLQSGVSSEGQGYMATILHKHNISFQKLVFVNYAQRNLKYIFNVIEFMDITHTQLTKIK